MRGFARVVHMRRMSICNIYLILRRTIFLFLIEWRTASCAAVRVGFLLFTLHVLFWENKVRSIIDSNIEKVRMTPQLCFGSIYL
jgi:hypothetical protein